MGDDDEVGSGVDPREGSLVHLARGPGSVIHWLLCSPKSINSLQGLGDWRCRALLKCPGTGSREGMDGKATATEMEMEMEMGTD